MTGIFLIRLHFRHRLYLHWLRLHLCLPWSWSVGQCSMELVQIVVQWKMIVIPCNPYIVSSTTASCFFPCSTDFMNSCSWISGNEPVKGYQPWCCNQGFSMRMDSTCSAGSGILGIYPGWSIPLYSCIAVTSIPLISLVDLQHHCSSLIITLIHESLLQSASLLS